MKVRVKGKRCDHIFGFNGCPVPYLMLVILRILLLSFFMHRCLLIKPFGYRFVRLCMALIKSWCRHFTGCLSVTRDKLRCKEHGYATTYRPQSFHIEPLDVCRGFHHEKNEETSGPIAYKTEWFQYVCIKNRLLCINIHIRLRTYTCAINYQSCTCMWWYTPYIHSPPSFVHNSSTVCIDDVLIIRYCIWYWGGGHWGQSRVIRRLYATLKFAN
jgi:hypothetical protein